MKRPPRAGSTNSRSGASRNGRRWETGLRRRAIDNPIPSSIAAAVLAALAAALPMLYQLASLYSTPAQGKLSRILTNNFWPFFGPWLSFILLASFTLAYGQLRSAKRGVDYLAEKVEDTAEGLGIKLTDTTSQLTDLTTRSDKNLDGLLRLNSAIGATTDSLTSSLGEIGGQVGALEKGVKRVDRVISRDVQRGIDSVERLTQEAATAARQALHTLKLGTLIHTINRTIDSFSTTRFPCGSETRTLQESRYLVYVRSGAPPGHVTPFYLEPHALSVRDGPSSNDDQKIQDLLQIAQCAATGKGRAWRLSEPETTSLWAVMRMAVGEAVTMPVVFDGDLAGVLVVLRSRLKPLFFQSSGDPVMCFGAATDAVANAADEIAPLLWQAHREFDTQNLTTQESGP